MELITKVTILSPAYPLRGGIASSTERLAYELQSSGYEVEIYTFSLQYPSFLFPGKTQYSEDIAPKGLRIKVAINSVNPFNWWRVGNEIKKAKPDIVISRFWLPFMGPSLGTILRRIKSNGHSKSIAIVDNIIPHEKRIGDFQLAKYYCNAVDGFVVMSKSVGISLQQFSKNPVSYIPHPIYDNYGEIVSRTAALQKLELPQDQKYLLFFGFIRDYKGLDLLLKAMADQRIQQKNIKLIVAGEYYGDKTKYEKIIVEHNLADRLILKTDFIPNEEVRFYFCAADLVVQPYKTATQSGISQLAYFFEKPMVATRVGGLPEIIDHGKSGYIVDVKVEAIADAIVDYFENDKAAEFTAQVKINKQKFSWANLVKGIKDLARGRS